MKNKNEYSLLIITSLPVKLIDGDFYALDLWCKDLGVNTKYVNKLGIVCPEVEHIKGTIDKVPPLVKVSVINELSSLNELIEQYDVIQLSGGRPFWQCYKEFYTLFIARKKSKKIIFSISSNRVKLTLLNAQGKNKLRQLKAKIVASAIYLTQKIISRYSDGVLLVGSSLKTNLGIKNPNIHIGLASWISQADIISSEQIQEKLETLPQHLIPKLCVCTRLEKMKGIHIALEALAILKDKYKLTPKLSIYGEGPELDNLNLLARELGISSQVSFLGYVAYGDTFFNEIRQYELMLLTNLSDEQPRLIFDAISQGLIPICPDTQQFKSVGLCDDVFFNKGVPDDLAKTISTFTNKKILSDSVNQLQMLLEQSTIDAMHVHRMEWIKKLL